MAVLVPRIQFQGICKRYPGVLALDSVSFEVGRGRVHAVAGENGAGKSTLMKILGGAVRADSGQIVLDGKTAQLRDARQAQRWGIAIVYQEFSLIPDLTVAENVFLGRWPQSQGWIDRRELRDRTAALFASLNLTIDIRGKAGDLSIAQQQMVEIARSLSQDARVLVLDEPSAVLTPNELARLFQFVRSLAARDVSVLYISHRLDEIFELCDDVTVLRDGRHISTGPVREVSRESLIKKMVGRSLSEEFPPARAPQNDEVLRVENLTAAGRFSSVSFDIRKGEVFALTGLVGSGRSSVGMALFGAIRAEGRVWLNGAAGPFCSPGEAKRAGIAYLPEDRKSQGLLLERPLRENISLAYLEDVAAGGMLRLGMERRQTRDRMRDLQIKATDEDAAASTLSGGNQQKVMIARWLQRPFRLIILDEPTRGVDVAAKLELYQLLDRLARAGAAVLVITSELPEAVGMADRIGVMCRGRLAGVVDNRQRDTALETLLRMAVGQDSTWTETQELGGIRA